MTALGLIIACGALSIVYGVWAITSVMSADAGSARMQEIAGAVHEGAQAYLKRQYTTISMVGIVLAGETAYLAGVPASLDAKDITAAKAALSATVSIVDKMATKGIIHRNTAGRYKSRLSSRLTKAAV